MISLQKVIKGHTYFIFNNDNRLIKNETYHIFTPISYFYPYIQLLTQLFLFITCYRPDTNNFLKVFINACFFIIYTIYIIYILNPYRVYELKQKLCIIRKPPAMFTFIIHIKIILYYIYIYES